MVTMRRRVLLILALLALAVPHQAVIAADTPTASLIAGHNDKTEVITLGAATTTLPGLDASGEGVFNLQNGSGKPITSLVVAIEATAPVKPLGYACSMFTALLRACTVQVNGNTITITFTGMPDIKTEAQFRLGFAPGLIAGPWPASAPVSVTINAQPAAGR